MSRSERNPGADRQQRDTSFFRNPSAFADLRPPLNALVRNLPQGISLRVWVPGCATGEEVYSLAIVVEETFQEEGRHPDIQFFGTDLSEIALQRARTGIYPAAIASDVSQTRLQQFFQEVPGGYQISKFVRDNCVFAKHDITRDPAFSHLDLISCRNILMNFQQELQQSLFPIFHFNLNAHGLLFLSSGETVDIARELFQPLDKEPKVFVRRPGPARATPRRPIDLLLTDHNSSGQRAAVSGVPLVKSEDLRTKVSHAIQSRYAPDVVVIGANWQICYFRGQTGFYLEPGAGEASYHLLQIARESLKPALRKAVTAAIQENISVEAKDIRLEHCGEVREINLQILPLSPESSQERYYLVVFERVTPPATSVATSVSGKIATPAISPESPEQRVMRLERELAEARDYIRYAAQEEEAALEELRAANEEIGSANEELQSTNEQLGTAKEELQSANEELTTVNEELETRNEDLTVLSNDLTNLLNAIHLPVLMVDGNLRLRRFTPTAGERFHLTVENLGQSLADLHVQLPWRDVDRVAREVIDNLTTQTQEIQDEKNCWWSLTVRPYRTMDQRIDGAVLTFADIDLLRKNLGAAQEARDQAGAIIDTVREPLVVLTPDLHVQRANVAFYHNFGMSPEEAVGNSLMELGRGQWNIPSLRQALEEVSAGNGELNGFEIEQRFPLIGLKCLRLSGRPILLVGSGPAILLAIEDITNESRAKQALLRSNDDLQRFSICGFA